MEADTVEEKREAGRGAVRYGRPPREHAGQVEERILDAAGRVFLEHGFQGASVDEIAEVASAGKPTIYARFPSKQALFSAVIDRLVRRNTSLDAFSCHGDSIEHRLDTLAAVMLTRVLTPETVGLIRVAVAEARRFPDLATSVSCMGRQRPTEAVARVFGELAASDPIGGSPAFAPEKLTETARRFLDLVVLPMLVQSAVRRGSGRPAQRNRAACRPGGRLLSRRLRARRQRQIRARARLRLRIIPFRRDHDP